MENTLRLGYLSKYRTELMGLSAVMILLCHASGNGIEMPVFLRYTIVQAQIGVNVFLFLSGMGLWYSLSKLLCSMRRWYLVRYSKLLVPYFIIQGTLTTISCIRYDTLDFRFWLSSISTIEFWFSHRAAWFVALLIPLYCVAPLLYSFFKAQSTVKVVILMIATYIIALFPLSKFGIQLDNNNVFYNIQFVMIRVPSFILGMYMAPYIKENANLKIIWFIPMLIGACVIFALTRTPIDAYMFLVLPIMYVMVRLFLIKDTSWFNRFCYFFGGISLESYLWNGLRIVIIPLMAYFSIPDYNNLLMYSLVLMVGTLLSVVVKKISIPIISKITNEL